VQVKHRQSRKCVVLGASGFIGTNLVEALLINGHDVVCFSRTALGDMHPKARSIIGDIANPPVELLSCLQEAVVFHLASSAKPATQYRSFEEQVMLEIAPTTRLVKSYSGKGTRWVFISSGGTVYGNPPYSPVDEAAVCKPLSLYGLAKLTLEHAIGIIAENSVIARIANPYGPGQSPLSGHGLVATLVHRVSKGLPITIWGNGETVRDYVYIGDVAQALMALGQSDVTGTFNLGSGEGHSILQMVEKIEAALGRKAVVDHQPARSIDVASNILDCSKISAALNWSAQTRLADGLAETIKWQMAQKY
jgi:UDP-glucose 4-epimerase